eukprot:Skav200741  [mRNA]  locus=scaffold2465:18422:19630:+ [translate_table: standard]
MAGTLKELLAASGVDDQFSDSLVNDGWTLALFACAATSLDGVDAALQEMLGTTYDQLNLLQKAAFRLAWQNCRSDQPASAQPLPAPSSSADPSASSSSWSESFAPKLTTAVDTGLRGPAILEAQAADRTIMNLVSDLVVERAWTYDNALYELTHVRAEIHTLLQARPKLPKQTMARLDGSSKGAGKSERMMPYGKSGGKSKSKGKGKVQWVTDTIQNGKRVQLCMRFQSGKCQLGSQCKFVHGCAYPLASGDPCMKNHGALQHSQTPH